MDDVSRKANVSKRTLYGFFDDKESLLIEVLVKIREPFTEAMALLEKVADTALDVILQFNEKMLENPTVIMFCEDFYEDLKRYPDAFDVILKGKQDVLDKIIALLRRGEQEAVFLSDVNYDIISQMAQKNLSNTSPPAAFFKYSFEEVHNTMFFILLRGICTDAGRKILEKYVIKRRLENKGRS